TRHARRRRLRVLHFLQARETDAGGGSRPPGEVSRGMGCEYARQPPGLHDIASTNTEPGSHAWLFLFTSRKAAPGGHFNSHSPAAWRSVNTRPFTQRFRATISPNPNTPFRSGLSTQAIVIP